MFVTGERPVYGISTGIYDLDYAIRGLHRGDLIVFTERTSYVCPGQMRHSPADILLTQISRYAGIEEGATVAYFSYRLNIDVIIRRLVHSHQKVHIFTYDSGEEQREQFDEFRAAANVIRDSSIYIDAPCRMNFAAIDVQCKELKAKANNLDLIIIDDVTGLLDYEEPNSAHSNLDELSWGLKNLAANASAPVISVFRPPSEGRFRSPYPELSDLNVGGGRLDKFSDAICGLSWARDGSSDHLISARFLQNRKTGMTADFSLRFDYRFYRAENLGSNWPPPNSKNVATAVGNDKSSTPPEASAANENQEPGI